MYHYLLYWVHFALFTLNQMHIALCIGCTVHLTMGALCLLHWIYFKTLILVHLAHGECAELCRLFEKASHKEVEVVFFLLKLIIATPALVLVEANG